MHSIAFLGNPGRGKSFLCNLVLNRDHFSHSIQSTAVTLSTSSASLPTAFNGQCGVCIFNVPGLLEAGGNESRFRHNAGQIQLALAAGSHCVVCYVFSAAAGGRLDDDDLISFHILQRAFHLADPGFIINYVPDKHKASYEDDMTNSIVDKLKLSKRPNIMFLKQVNISDSKARASARDSVMAFLSKVPWCPVVQHQPIETDAMRELRLQQEAMERQRQQMAEIARKSSATTSAQHGGFGGGAFNDMEGEPPDCRLLRRVEVRSGCFVDAIQLFWDNRTGGKHGGGGGHHHSFQLNHGEYITKVTGRSGTFIDQICFHTSQGRTCGPYGGGGGSAFTCEAPAGHALAWIAGRSGCYVDRLYFWWMKY